MTNTPDLKFCSIKSYMNEIKRIPILTRTEEVKLFKQYHKGSRKAKEKLINANLRFVVSVAKKYKTPHMSLMDLINEGNIGLITAIKKFDIKRNVNFISYGVWWIRQSILKAISEQSRTIRVPANISNNIVKINKHSNRLSQILGRVPTMEEVAQETKLSKDDIESCLIYSKSCTSLEKKIGHSSDDEVQYFLKDSSKNEPHFQVEKNYLKTEINSVLNTLTRKERIVLIHRYGLNNIQKESLEKIGIKFGVSKERIRQIEEKALINFKKSSKKIGLDVYLQDN